MCPRGDFSVNPPQCGLGDRANKGTLTGANVADRPSRSRPLARRRVVRSVSAPLQISRSGDGSICGFFSLEPHLSQAHSLGGFSGPDLFTQAWQAFTDLLNAEHIEYR